MTGLFGQIIGFVFFAGVVYLIYVKKTGKNPLWDFIKNRIG